LKEEGPDITRGLLFERGTSGLSVSIVDENAILRRAFQSRNKDSDLCIVSQRGDDNGMNKTIGDNARKGAVKKRTQEDLDQAE
jgi:hypothetical protein